MRKNNTISFVGSNGLPNKYGGFESFLEAVAPVIARNGVDVLVTCDPSKYSDREPWFEGVRRIFIPIRANGIWSIPHDLLAFVSVYRQSRTVVFLGVSGALFLPFMKLLAFFTNTRIAVNIDGVEWRRDKFNLPTKYLLKLLDRMSQQFADVIVYDNACLVDFVCARYRRKAVLIPYSADQVKRFKALPVENGTAFTVCRIEPENNVELLLIAASKSNILKYTIVGNWDNSEYGKALKQKFSHYANIDIKDPIYNPDVIAQYREQCQIYLHGHSVGGTNPSLIEMLPYRCEILCFDCTFNRETCGSDADYFSDSNSLIHKINSALERPIGNQRALQDRYKASVVAQQYAALLQD